MNIGGRSSRTYIYAIMCMYIFYTVCYAGDIGIQDIWYNHVNDTLHIDICIYDTFDPADTSLGSYLYTPDTTTGGIMVSKNGIQRTFSLPYNTTTRTLVNDNVTTDTPHCATLALTQKTNFGGDDQQWTKGMYTFDASIAHWADAIGDTNPQNNTYTSQIFLPWTYSTPQPGTYDLVPNDVVWQNNTFIVEVCNIGTSMTGTHTLTTSLLHHTTHYRTRTPIMLMQNMCENIMMTDTNIWLPKIHMRDVTVDAPISSPGGTAYATICNTGAPMNASGDIHVNVHIAGKNALLYVRGIQLDTDTCDTIHIDIPSSVRPDTNHVLSGSP